MQSLAQGFTTSVKEQLRIKGLLTDKPQKSSKITKVANNPNTSTSVEAPKGPTSASVTVLAIVWMFVSMATFFISLILPEESYTPYAGADWIPPIIFATGFIIFLVSIISVSSIAKYEEHTEKGLEYSRYLEGLKLYISMAEADRLNFLQSVKGADTSHAGVVKLYEKLLPYATLFGLEKSWLNELSRYYEFDDVSAPTWYIGIGAFRAHEFASAMHALTSTTGTTITHSTTVNSSSSGSGFSGGFSGGGGGGGGGGGW